MKNLMTQSLELCRDENVSIDDRLACPQCESPLLELGEELLCSACQRRWPIINGIPHFVTTFPYWGEIPLQQMLEVNRRAEAERWDSALADSQDQAVRRASEMILNLERANWQWLLDLPSASRVLDIGSGMGTNSHALALHYRHVVALEPVLERVKFMQQRFLQEKLSNVAIVRSSIWALPFAPQSFDLIAMNGVLEWVAEGRTEDPRALQELALRKAFRLLKPGGYLYLGIENRFVPGYFVGYPDPHCGLPFVTVLPRPVAQWYARRKGQGGYRNYLYSSRGYRKLLKGAGFDSAEVYAALPSYNHPRFLVPLRGNVFSHYWQNFGSGQGRGIRGLLQHALLKTGVLKYLEYSYAILARKGYDCTDDK